LVDLPPSFSVSLHTYAESLRKNNIDLPTVQTLLGHKSLETTAKYLHVTKDDLKKAVL